MTDKPFDLDAYRRDYDKRLRAKEDKAKVNQNMENDDIIVTPHGAFKKPKGPANDVPKPEIFKMLMQTGAHIGGGHILVHNQDRSWEGKLPLTPEIYQFFGGESVKYVIATADASGKLHMQYGIIPDEYNKF